MLENLKNFIFNSEKVSFDTRFAVGMALFIAVGTTAIFAQEVAIQSLAFLLAAACLSLGIFVGFLFGIPKTFQIQNNPQNPNTHRPNTNLEEISDWLTKIIVGLGLVNLKEIPPKIQQTAEYIAPQIANLANKETDKIVIASAISLTNSIMIYSSIIGFIGGYLVTRVYLAGFIRRGDQELNNSVGMKESLANLQESINKLEVKTSTLPRTAPQKLSSDDPEKGKWGGQTERNGRKISAIVGLKVDDNDYRNITITVESTDVSNPLTGFVKFYLHPTFVNSRPIIFVKDGKAILNIIAWGAFTLGAEADGGDTQLELDLSESRWGGDEIFRNR